MAQDTPVIHADDEIENADWTKTAWDLPTDKAGLLTFLKASGVSVAEFKTWPVYRWNVDKMAWLKDLEEVTA